MAATDSVEQGNVQRHWGELQQLLPKTIPLHIDMAEPKAAEYEVPRLHQPSCEHFPPKDELPAKFMASVKPPLDKHSQNLTLHCIELQHHKRRMRLMLMAAQHQYGEGGKSESSDASSLPAHPPRSKRFCSSQGIITPPTQSTILSRAQETPSTLEQNSTLTCAELDSVSNRHLLMQSVATLCALAGFDMASESALEILTDILDDFNTKFCRLLRMRVDNQAMHGRTGFPDAMEYALHEIGLGGYSGIHKYWTQGIQDYVLRLDQEDLEMINEYKSFFDPVTRASSESTQEGHSGQGYTFKSELDMKGNGTFYKMSVGTDTSDQTSDFAHLSPYAVVPNGSMTGGGNSDPTSPNWGMTYIKTEGEEEETFDDPDNWCP
ncbi:STAGA complex 65 subunit gamma-like [Acropora millepora]|uniref:STAGA complex 65 subunit gamma-like n=1 Tax=Acropora millepora TaxID=45264 RepID=UPI001CF14EF5|nr:STAGA complex 65 subunit gamma-like [Acropora millepora]